MPPRETPMRESEDSHLQRWGREGADSSGVQGREGGRGVSVKLVASGPAEERSPGTSLAGLLFQGASHSLCTMSLHTHSPMPFLCPVPLSRDPATLQQDPAWREQSTPPDPCIRAGWREGPRTHSGSRGSVWGQGTWPGCCAGATTCRPSTQRRECVPGRGQSAGEGLEVRMQQIWERGVQGVRGTSGQGGGGDGGLDYKRS